MVPTAYPKHLYMGTSRILVSILPSRYLFTWKLTVPYRNVGFLRYWTLSNVPLFCLAAPMLAVLVLSSAWSLKTFFRATGEKIADDGNGHQESIKQRLLVQLAIPQALLAVAALTTYHVQIINRISSGYPVWYWYIAAHALQTYKSSKLKNRASTATIRGMAMYGLVQAVLYGSFLPPA